ncbi:MAG: hypothetical protein CM15mP18_0920 [Methanobacteriota archaeon]|nr:MAG: hypothetical protein CM15mP18_0920 [Euryarchaeota archaeon]
MLGTPPLKPRTESEADDYGIGCNRVGAAQMPDLEDRDCWLLLRASCPNGVPERRPFRHPPSIVALYITPEVPLNASPRGWVKTGHRPNTK